MILEACVKSFNEAVQAEKKGATRIELCSHLDLDGLTPSSELIQKCCLKLNIPVMVMIRPRKGNFIYSDQEIDQMKKEIDLAKDAGAYGVVFGLLTNKNKIDIKKTRNLVNHAFPLKVTFHKAIDNLINPIDGVKDILSLKGINRILTSGGKPTALEGSRIIKEMIKVSENQITILVAGKVIPDNLNKIRELTGAREFHGRLIVGELKS